MNTEIYRQRRLFFAEKVYFYQVAIGVFDYEIIIHEGLYTDNRAEYEIDECGKIVSLSFNKEWISKSSVSYTEIDKVAFHEIFEIGLYKLKSALLDNFSHRFVEILIHEQVRRAEYYLWPLLREKKKIGDLDFSPAEYIEDICRFDDSLGEND